MSAKLNRHIITADKIIYSFFTTSYTLLIVVCCCLYLFFEVFGNVCQKNYIVYLFVMRWYCIPTFRGFILKKSQVIHVTTTKQEEEEEVFWTKCFSNSKTTNLIKRSWAEREKNKDGLLLLCWLYRYIDDNVVVFEDSAALLRRWGDDDHDHYQHLSLSLCASY